jgi:tetratricopeptide (TPR) repeat protein
MRRDPLDHALTGATKKAAAAFEAGLAELRCYRGDPVAQAERAIAEAPGFAMAHALRAWLHLLGTEPSALPVAREAHADLVRTAQTDREKGHAAAVGHLVEGRWHAAGRVLEDVTIDHPRDGLALLAGHQIDFFTGHSRMLRDRIARALPHWDAAMPGYHSILGMHAFGLEETGDYARAESAGRRAVELEPKDGWAGDSFFQVHNWWHLALYHLEEGDIDAVLTLFDNQIYGAKSGVVLDMVDASSLLWRLHLRSVDVGNRWQAIADNWAPIAAAGRYAFNDLHAVMAFTGAGRKSAAQSVLAAQKEAMTRADDNAGFTADVGHAACLAVIAFGDGDYERAVDLLRPIRSIAARFGGSHAQRDVIDLTLIEAARRAGDANLAAALAAERTDRRHRGIGPHGAGG